MPTHIAELDNKTKNVLQKKKGKKKALLLAAVLEQKGNGINKI
jgi:hypothetical protein